MCSVKLFFRFFIVTTFLLHGCKTQSKLLNPDNAVFTQQAPAVFKVQLETTKGNIILEVSRDLSPNGADRFYNLVRYGYYDNTAFFRVRDKTFAQFGIASDPKIAQAWRNKTIPDDPLKSSSVRGMVSYAFKDLNGRTTQVYINLRDNSSTFDKEPFVPFAKVTQGMDVADALYSGYGEKSGGGIRAGHQDSLFTEGNAYLKLRYPKLDYIKKARILKD